MLDAGYACTETGDHYIRIQVEGKPNCKVVGSEPGFGLTERGKALTSQMFLPR